MAFQIKICATCGGNLINGGCPEHKTPSFPLETKGADVAEKLNDTSTLDEAKLSPPRLGGVGRLLTALEMELITKWRKT
jgi:hypothetical protein